MRRTFFLLLLATAAALAMGMGVAGAQENATNTTNGMNATASSPETIELDDVTRITEWEIEDGVARVTIETDFPRTVVLSDGRAGVTSEGATRVPEQRHDLPSGTHTLSMNLEEVKGGSTLSVSTTGGTVRLSSGMEETEQNPLSTFGGESGLFTGVIMSVALAALSAAYVVRSEDSGVIEA